MSTTVGKRRAAGRARAALHGGRGSPPRRAPGALRRARLHRPRHDAAPAEAADGQRLRRHLRGPRGAGRQPRRRRVAHRPRGRGRATRRWSGGSPRRSARPAGACTSAARATTSCWPRCACICSMPPRTCSAARSAWPRHSPRSASGRRTRRCPATPTCSRPCRARCTCGPTASRRRSATTPRASPRPAGGSRKNPLGSAAGYGVPGPAHRPRIHPQAPRLRRGPRPGHGRADLPRQGRGRRSCSSSRLLMQDLGRLAADLLLFYTQEFAFVKLPGEHDHRLLDHAAEAQPRRARAGARRRPPRCRRALLEILALPAKLPSGYQRDLQRMKGPAVPRHRRDRRELRRHART